VDADAGLRTREAITVAVQHSEEELADELARLDSAGLRRRLRSIERLAKRRLRIDGKDVVDFASNDYLGLATDPRVAVAARAALTGRGFGGASARLIAGNDQLHDELEREIARFKRAEAALLFSSGYLANTGCIPALAGREDVIFSDELNHASLVDGCRLSRATVRVFRHLDLAHLKQLLEESGSARRRLIVVDGVFSMDGDVFPLDQLVLLAREHDAWTYVDDAHGTGVLGETGRGSAELYDVEGAIDVLMGTLGKAVGTTGAFVCGSRALVDLLTNKARSFVFTTATPPSNAAASLASLSILDSDSSPREALWNRCDYLRRAISGTSLEGRILVHDRAGHIIPIIIGDALETMRLGEALLARGFLIGAVRPPTVPEGESRLRITLSAEHSEGDIDALLRALSIEIEAA
jgi:8-amino-7-oxononanoate synthase